VGDTCVRSDPQAEDLSDLSILVVEPQPDDSDGLSVAFSHETNGSPQAFAPELFVVSRFRFVAVNEGIGGFLQGRKAKVAIDLPIIFIQGACTQVGHKSCLHGAIGRPMRGAFIRKNPHEVTWNESTNVAGETPMCKAIPM